MPYPREYTPRNDFVQAARAGTTADELARKLSTEFAALTDVTNQLVVFIRALATVDKKLKSAAAQAMTLVDSETFTATAGQTTFTFVSITDVDATNHYARVFTDAAGGGTLELIDPASVSLTTSDVTIPAQSVGATVVVEMYQNGASVIARLADNAANEGASLVAIEDVANQYTAADVENALAEIMTAFNTFTTAFGQVSDYIRADGTIDFTADQSMGGNRLTNVDDGVDGGDAVNVSQFQAISNQFSNLLAKFLSLSGGTMSGPIDMGNNLITNVTNGASSGDAINKGQLDSLETELRDDLLPRDGSLAATGDIPLGGNKITGLADGTDDDDAATFGQIESEVSSQLADASAVNIGGTGVLKNLPQSDPTCTDIGIGSEGPGIYDYNNLTVAADTTIPKTTVIRVRGDFTLSAKLTVDARGDTATMFHTVTGEEGFVESGAGSGGSGNGGHGGGGAGGNGGRGSGTPNPPGLPTEEALAGEHYPEFSGVMALGGDTETDMSNFARGGGCVYILVEGDCIFTGGEIEANGENSIRVNYNNGTINNDTSSGGGGGGMIVVICKGTITDGAFTADGGDEQTSGGSNERRGGGGGGGRVEIYASEFAGTQTLSVDGGTGYTGASDAGEDGITGETTLTAAQISAIGGRII